MSSIAYMLERLSVEERRTHASQGDVRAAVARTVGVACGTIENLERGRLKFIERVEGRIRAAFIKLLEKEIARATHELEVARLTAEENHDPTVIAAQASLRRRIEEAQEALK